jgi:hypothetical protein
MIMLRFRVRVRVAVGCMAYLVLLPIKLDGGRHLVVSE